MPFTDDQGRPGKYTGEVNGRGLPHGRGTLQYSNGLFHEGDWVEGRRVVQNNNTDGDADDLKSFVSMASQSQYMATPPMNLAPQYHPHIQNQNRHHPNQIPRQQQQQPPRKHISNMPWSDVNGFSGHYTGEVNMHDAPDGRGYMQYSNGVVEEGMWRNGVFQPPERPPTMNRNVMYPGGDDGVGEGGPVPSSSMSVWSLRSAPNMMGNAYGQNGMGSGSASVMGGRSQSVLEVPSMYGNMQPRY